MIYLYTLTARNDTMKGIKNKSIFLLAFLLICASFISFNIKTTPENFQSQVAGKPNFLFIYTDDQRYNTIHALGNSEIITPNLDKLVQNGTTFTHAFNMGAWHGAVCVASRSMLMTGMSVWDVKEQENDLLKLQEKNEFWSQQLKGAGYETYFSGKWHVNIDVNKVFDHVRNVRPGMALQNQAGYNRPLSPQDTLWQPWDAKQGGQWQGGKHWNEVLADDADLYLNEASKSDKPFFMYLAFNAPHDPRQAPKRWVDQYPLDKIILPENFLEEYPYAVEMGCGQDLRDEKLAPFPRTAFAVKKHIQEYYASISYLDEQIGRILSALRNSGQFENTYIIFTSDHGLGLGQHGLMGKQSMFDHSMRPPLVIAGPKIPKGERRDQLVYLQDVMATTYDIAHIQKPQQVYFHSLMPYIFNKKQASSYPEIYGCYMDTQRMVRTDRYKMIVYPKASKVILFDLKKDPLEMNDIAGVSANAAILKDLKLRLVRQQKQLNDGLDLTDILKGI